MHDWISTLGFAIGPAWICGVNLYATVATLGLLQRFGYAHLPGDLSGLSNSWVIGVAAFLYLVEFIADKVPVVDTAWDAVHTFIRVPAGAILAASAFADFPPAVRIVAMLVGGSFALASHGAKAATRVAVNTSPEPFSNIAVSAIEDVFAFGATLLLVWSPLLILIAAIVFFVFAIWMAPKMARAIRKLFRWRSKPSAINTAVAG